MISFEYNYKSYINDVFLCIILYGKYGVLYCIASFIIDSRFFRKLFADFNDWTIDDVV